MAWGLPHQKFICILCICYVSGYFTFEIHAAGNYHKVKNVQGMLQSGFALCESIQIDPGQLNTRQFSPLLFNSLNCYENLFKGFIL